MRFDDKMNMSTPLISFEEAARMLCFTPESAQSKYSAGTFPVRVANIGRKRVVRRDEVMQFIERILPPLPQIIVVSSDRQQEIPTKPKRGRPRLSGATKSE
jgi:hypothetical protein